MKLIILGRLPSLNDYIQAERSNRYAGAKMKKDYTSMIYWLCREQKLEARLKPCHITFKWYEANKKRDLDNIAYGKKFCIDGLVKAGILYNDTQEWVKGFTDEFYIDKDNPRIIVEIK
jgi:Holliday junction resolvase RusA-like endonuclease